MNIVKKLLLLLKIIVIVIVILQLLLRDPLKQLLLFGFEEDQTSI